jgi:cobalt-zinc-cadmium efflux system outer membrane protein
LREKIILPWMILLALPLLVYAQASGDRVLSLDDCLSVALHQSLAVKSADNAVHSAQLAHEEIGRTALPLVTVDGKAWSAPNSERFGYDPAVTDGGQFSAQLGVQELLYDGGARGLRADQLDIDIGRLQTERRRAQRDLKYTVTVAFLDLLEAQREAALQQQRVDELADYLGLVNRLFHGGGVSYTDVLKTEVSYENARVTLRRAIQSRTAAKVYLAEAMGAPQDTAFSVTGTLDTPDSDAIDSLLYRFNADTLHNLDLQISESNVQRSMIEVDVVRRERLPSISLTGDFGLLSSGDNLYHSAERRPSVLGYSIGISIENLLFNWGATDLRIQQRELEADNMQLFYEQQRRGLVAELVRLRVQVTSAIEQLHSITRTLKIAEDNFALTKAQYAGGGTTALEVLSAEQLLAENRLADLQTRAELQRFFARANQLTAQ